MRVRRHFAIEYDVLRRQVDHGRPAGAPPGRRLRGSEDNRAGPGTPPFQLKSRWIRKREPKDRLDLTEGQHYAIRIPIAQVLVERLVLADVDGGFGGRIRGDGGAGDRRCATTLHAVEPAGPSASHEHLIARRAGVMVE